MKKKLILLSLLLTGIGFYILNVKGENFIESYIKNIFQNESSDIGKKWLQEDIIGKNEPLIDAVFPVGKYEISSGFGPRLKASDDYRYDFHRGIDIHGTKGDDVVAIADGEIFRVYQDGEAGSPYKNGGTVIIIKHNLMYPYIHKGQPVNKFYSIYMHLDSVDDIIVNNTTNTSPYYKIQKGEKIGELGQSGDTIFNHVHFETRVGTTCSREFQLANPTKTCAKTLRNNSDPHVNPYVFVPGNDLKSLEYEVMSEKPLKIKVSSQTGDLDFNSIKVGFGQNIKDINFNERLGIDPLNIDNNTYNGVVITPAIYNSRVDKYEIIFEFSDTEKYSLIEIKDIWGNGKRYSFE